MENCTFCQSGSIVELRLENDRRRYYFCEECNLIFTDPLHHLSRATEIKHYLLHDNGPQYEGHVKFLSRIIDQALIYLTPEMTGLDYGCGPVPTLSVVLRNKGLVCYDYDPLFNFDHPLEVYNYVFATECFEHFYKPGEDFHKIDKLLRIGGYLAVMTYRWDNLAHFSEWHYKTEITHVSFFHIRTFEYICKTYNYRIKFKDQNRIIILQKQ